MSLERKIVSSFLLLVVLLIGVGFVWEFYYTQINEKQFLESKNATLVVEYTNKMEVGLYQSLLHLNLLHETRSNLKDIDDVRDIPLPAQSRKGFEDGLEAFYSSSTELEKMIANKPVLQEEINELKKRVLLYESLSKDWLKIKDELVDQSNVLFLSSIAPYFLNNIIPKFEEIRSIAIYQQDEVIDKLDNQLSQGKIINYSATFLILIIGAVVGVFLYRSIVKPLQKLTNSVKKFGEGDLSQRVDVEYIDEFSFVAEAFNTMAENLEQQTISSTYLDNVMESISESIFVTDNEGTLKRLNEAGAEMLELHKSDLIGRSIYNFFNLTKTEENAGLDKIQEYQLETVKDNKVPVLFSESDLYEDGEKKGRVIVVRNISELKNAENEIKKSLDEKNVMLAEIHHRVKNNLAVVSGLLQLQVMHTDSDEIHKALTDSQLRVQSIALIHEKLYSSDSLAYINYDRYIDDLLNTINQTYSSDNKSIEVKKEIDELSLNINQAIPCSLLVNEVLVNIFKHAFTDQKQGEIVIKIAEKDNEVSISISDDGKGIIENKESENGVKSLGFTLIKTLSNQLKAEFSFDNKKDSKGSIFKLSFAKES